MNQPKDPVLLMSVVNTYLRDKYSDPHKLCDDCEWNFEEMNAALEKAGFRYRPETNQYR